MMNIPVSKILTYVGIGAGCGGLGYIVGKKTTEKKFLKESEEFEETNVTEESDESEDDDTDEDNTSNDGEDASESDSKPHTGDYTEKVRELYPTPDNEPKEPVKPAFKSKKENTVRVITEGEYRTVYSEYDSEYLKYRKDTNEIFDDRDVYLANPRILLKDTVDELEDNFIWPMYIVNEDMMQVFEIDCVD